ncbi:uncharacterized protein TrAtP1_011685 [Trichoderma atroviride]|uniref:uncharacterized protein n=1 Tax=Hypocrea atroviridis TaxID=63577 RepID=UPI003330746E|nr:hypothetical protein TrAtP1_011685 [Trichoderma atroviride]
MLPPAVEFPQLSNLSLGMMALTLDETVQLITKFAGSLQRLELWRFQLMADPGTDVDMEEKKQNLYISLLKRLLAIPNLNLRHIKLGMLQQMLDVSGRYNKMQAIEFTKDEPASTDGEKDAAAPAAQHTRRRPTNNSMEYTGSDWRHFVRHEMMPRLHIINPDEGVDRLSSDEEPEDLSEDDEDEEMDE